ncbi:hypothetical protein QZH41_010785 [Actinostola sp. cb2023]|nr:hypothetical protein QZH41_010785 [Actinostola sp. cb2023]
MADFTSVFAKVCDIFGIASLNSHQKTAITQMVTEKKDMFINLPAGFGKSLIYQALPTVFDEVECTTGHVVVIVSPLLTLIHDQVESLRRIGISAVSLSHLEDEREMEMVERGIYSLIYATPESILKNERWRKMLSSSVYTKKLCAIAVDEAHVIKQWGTSSSNKLSPFRECYARLHELRSLAPEVNMIALTATAVNSTKSAIIDILQMMDPFIISESPNKLNVTYAVEYLPKDVEIEYYFAWLVKDLCECRVNAERTIIYCQTIKQCGMIYATLRSMLGKQFYIGELEDNKSTIVEMLHSCTPTANKKNILESFGDPTGTVRVLVATIAFGMGVDCKGVHRTIHFGPSKNIESFIQESGRAGRDGAQSTSYILYQGLLLTHVEKNIKEFLKSKECRR